MSSGMSFILYTIQLRSTLFFLGHSRILLLSQWFLDLIWLMNSVLKLVTLNIIYLFNLIMCHAKITGVDKLGPSTISFCRLVWTWRCMCTVSLSFSIRANLNVLFNLFPFLEDVNCYILIFRRCPLNLVWKMWKRLLFILDL